MAGVVGAVAVILGIGIEVGVGEGFANIHNTVDSTLIPMLSNIENREFFQRWLAHIPDQTSTLYNHTMFANLPRLPTFAEKRAAAVAAFMSVLRASKKRKQFTVPSLPIPTDPKRLTSFSQISTRVDKFYFRHPKFSFVYSVSVQQAPGQPSQTFKHIVRVPGGPVLRCKDLDRGCVTQNRRFF